MQETARLGHISSTRGTGDMKEMTRWLDLGWAILPPSIRRTGYRWFTVETEEVCTAGIVVDIFKESSSR
ncbi:hypothetical protein AAFF_G00381780 [Aldrovandia affinis]|uniref:Uncharacterized protein n=1 Tax=Aldrovandia affinis TaxID=143900 RepID=A0AAD7X048_9TELE|nr:hypothetical protein AAFF_G00381780 [Aldrovandia affinis]